MQTQNYVYYMHFLVLKESEQKRARALFVKKCDFFDSKSMLTSLIALELFSGQSWNKYALKKFTSKGLNVRARYPTNTLWVILVHFLHAVCRFIGNLAWGIHFWGQNKYSSILTGALVAGSYIMGHLPSYLHVVATLGNWASSNIYITQYEKYIINWNFRFKFEM